MPSYYHYGYITEITVIMETMVDIVVEDLVVALMVNMVEVDMVKVLTENMVQEVETTVEGV